MSRSARIAGVSVVTLLLVFAGDLASQRRGGGGGRSRSSGASSSRNFSRQGPAASGSFSRSASSRSGRTTVPEASSPIASASSSPSCSWRQSAVGFLVPIHQFGFSWASQSQAMPPFRPPGSEGRVCLSSTHTSDYFERGAHTTSRVATERQHNAESYCPKRLAMSEGISYRMPFGARASLSANSARTAAGNCVERTLEEAR